MTQPPAPPPAHDPVDLVAPAAGDESPDSPGRFRPSGEVPSHSAGEWRTTRAICRAGACNRINRGGGCAGPPPRPAGMHQPPPPQKPPPGKRRKTVTPRGVTTTPMIFDHAGEMTLVPPPALAAEPPELSLNGTVHLPATAS